MKYTRDDMISIKYEGGPANGTAGGVYPNVHTVYYGNKGEEQVYKRTDRADKKGRVIFAHTGPATLPNA